MKTRNGLLAFACALLLLAAVPALADHHEEAAGGMSEAEMMAAFMKSATPGEAHAMMAKDAGTWNLTMKVWMAPGGEPTVSKAVAKRTLEMDGRHMIEKVEGTLMGMPFFGEGVSGHNNVNGEYWTTWRDNMSTGITTMTGKYDEASKTYTYWAEGPDPMTGQVMKTKTVVEKPSENKEVMSMYSLMGGEEIKTLEITYVRADS